MAHQLVLLAPPLSSLAPRQQQPLPPLSLALLVPLALPLLQLQRLLLHFSLALAPPTLPLVSLPPPCLPVLPLLSLLLLVLRAQQLQLLQSSMAHQLVLLAPPLSSLAPR